MLATNLRYYFANFSFSFLVLEFMYSQHDKNVFKIPADTDIYLIDQIMKGRYNIGDIVLDAGCGEGRNMHWFLQNNLQIFGIDVDEDAIRNLKTMYPQLAENRLSVSVIEKTVFDADYFDHIICSAVLHFANSTAHFSKMLAEITRILRPGGTVFSRMTSDIGIESMVEHRADGVYNIPDGSQRFLLTKKLLNDCLLLNKLALAEPLKTVNVNDERCMSTILLQKL